MAHSAPLIIRLVASSVRTARRAGDIIRNVMAQGDLRIVEKGKNDYQTEADRSAQQCIIKSLERQFPSITIIGEEEQSSCDVPHEWIVTESEPDILSLDCPEELQNIRDEEVVVWVDPLDGTSEFTQGLVDHVTVLIGIAVGDRSVAGIIHQPYYKNGKGANCQGRTLWGIRGIGVGGFEAQMAPSGQRIIVTTRSHRTPEVHDAVEALQPAKVMYVGGAGHKVILLLEGKAHAYVFPSTGCKRWDTCAPEAVLAAAGGKLTDVNGHEYSYCKDTPYMNSSGVLATGAGQDHEWYIRKIPGAVRDKFV
ncbi:Putative inositol monophosphatase 3 [Gryllus bimaculatus]|nr:Putative inositol monophosphatase 3 [Gryllus bimaculatus]